MTEEKFSSEIIAQMDENENPSNLTSFDLKNNILNACKKEENNAIGNVIKTENESFNTSAEAEKLHDIPRPENFLQPEGGKREVPDNLIDNGNVVKIENESPNSSLEIEKLLDISQLENLLEPEGNAIKREVPDNLIDNSNIVKNEAESFNNSVETEKLLDISQNAVLKNLVEPGDDATKSEVPANLIDNTLQSDLNASFSDFTNVPAAMSNVDINTNCINEDEFSDATQFLNDPCALEYLNSAGSSNNLTTPAPTRSSLYENFDPLHKVDNKYEASDTIPEQSESSVSIEDNSMGNFHLNLTVDKQINCSVNESTNSNVLITFDSPAPIRRKKLSLEDKAPLNQKLYTEEEFKEALKMQELQQTEGILRKQQEEGKYIAMLIQANEFYREKVAECLQAYNTALSKKAMLELGNKKLQQELKAALSDLQIVEKSFSDFHKRYEQCKDFINSYKQNEEGLKVQLKETKSKLDEQQKMSDMLKLRTQEEINKANNEVKNVKKTSDAQAAALKAQLQKADMTTSRLKSDIAQARIEHSKLEGMCDELISKVRETE